MFLENRSEELERLTRLHASLTQVKQAMQRVLDRDSFVREVCRILVEVGRQKKAAVLWGDAPPSSRESHVLEGVATFPIHDGGVVSGFLLIGSGEESIGERERQLFLEVAEDISLVLENLRREEARRSMEARLRSERDFSNAVLDSLPGVLYLYDREGHFLRWNRQFESVTGLAPERIEAMHPLDLFRGQDREAVASRIEEVFEKGFSSVEAEMVCRDDQLIPHYFTGRTLELDGRTCLVGVGIDVSERRRAEKQTLETQARYETLFQRAPDGILLADTSGVYVDANASICAMLGYDRDELVGMSGADIVCPEELERIARTIEEIRSGGDYQHEWRFRRRDGSTFPAEVIATLMPDGTIMAMVRDITERKRSEEALRELNMNLEQRVEARTIELEAARVRAEAADRLKSAFLATMSHELRTPLNSIIGFTGILLQELAGPLTEEQGRQLGMVKSSARHLLDLINDILDLSRIEAGQLTVAALPFDLRRSLDTAVETVRPLARRKGLSLSLEVLEVPEKIVGDRRRFEQILLNLLNNAIKFTDRGEIVLRAEVMDVTGPGSHARLAVIDTGIGIQPQDLASLFKPFRQLDAGLARQHEGTGLGLVICKRLSDLLGGSLSVESVPGVGSTFALVLPLSSPGGSP